MALGLPAPTSPPRASGTRGQGSRTDRACRSRRWSVTTDGDVRLSTLWSRGGGVLALSSQEGQVGGDGLGAGDGRRRIKPSFEGARAAAASYQPAFFVHGALADVSSGLDELHRAVNSAQRVKAGSAGRCCYPTVKTDRTVASTPRTRERQFQVSRDDESWVGEAEAGLGPCYLEVEPPGTDAVWPRLFRCLLRRPGWTDEGSAQQCRTVLP